ncbi:hypothetical protein CCHL11_06598 [Colletotrichum chlorophyti]|uniref:Fungal N-terminal domain-containing protein n=1 Tax=Colletotrichum chlorophyti TaxID=708187 RepID=A0A1Q8RXU1_9PEZI|nr:hypothetical protein CCHL11_06598 [Colletotrichum chlorophyti]
MAELLGTVVGVVSFGIQVCSGIKIDLDGIQCRQEEIESTARHCRSMETLLSQMEALDRRLPATTAPSNTALEQAMLWTNSELTALREFIVKIDTYHAIPRSLAGKMKHQKQTLLYPSRRDHLDRLSNSLVRMNESLQTSLQLVEIKPFFSSLSKVFIEDMLVKMKLGRLLLHMETLWASSKQTPRRSGTTSEMYSTTSNSSERKGITQ